MPFKLVSEMAYGSSYGPGGGIAKGADLSVAYKDYAAIIQRAGLGQVRG